MSEILGDVCRSPEPELLDEPICYVDAMEAPEPAGNPPGLSYGEPQLTVRPVATSYGVPDLLGELLAAGSAPRREEIVRARLCRLGFKWLVHGTVRQDHDGADYLELFTTYAHAGWARRYLAERYHEVDPRWHDAPPGGVPLMWETQDIWSRVQERWAGERGYRFAEELCDSGLRSGLYFRVVSPVPLGGQAVVSFASSAPRRHWLTEEVVGQALTLGLCLHEFLSRHVRRPGLVLPSPLHDVRQDILRCLSHGLTNKQVANQLGISLYTVEYHLRYLRRHFSVRNRTQLVLASRGGGTMGVESQKPPSTAV